METRQRTQDEKATSSANVVFRPVPATASLKAEETFTFGVSALNRGESSHPRRHEKTPSASLFSARLAPTDASSKTTETSTFPFSTPNAPAFPNPKLFEKPLVKDKAYDAHMALLGESKETDTSAELATTPLLTESLHQYSLEATEKHNKAAKTNPKLVQKSPPFSQFGLFCGNISEPGNDPRLFYNVAAPSSVFICGSQGSGKSHTLSCMLENCLIPYDGNTLPRPLTGLVFHYDSFVSDVGGSPCEAAYLSSNRNVSVRVLCAPTNIGHIKRIYKNLPKVNVEPLTIEQSDLNTRRMLDLMAVSSVQGSMPLYLHVISRILRDMRKEQQVKNTTFNYARFRALLDKEQLTEGQQAPLKQRLETLESFMVKSQVRVKEQASKGSPQGTAWSAQAGELTIIDLSCPCVTAEMACSLFTICLSLFLEQDPRGVGRVVALDEAHKYMTDSAECQTLTDSLLQVIRLQRHLGARVLISTQEPTISPRLLDLCSVTVVHRFTSPDWLDMLKKHLAGASKWAMAKGDVAGIAAELFGRIVALRAGEALLFAPSMITGVVQGYGIGESDELVRLGNGVLKVRVRMRITQDGGRSIMAA